MKVLYIPFLAICLVTQLVVTLPDSHRDVGRVAVVYSKTEPNYCEPVTVASNDSHFDKQWALSKIMAPEAWQVTSGDSNVIIAVLDTGIDCGHEDLAGKVVAEVNFADSPTSYDIYGHGTHVAGIIAAAKNSLGVVGVAYDCLLMNVKIADEGGSWNSSAAAKGIIWAVDNGANVINMSLSAKEPSSDLEQAINYAWSKGAVVVCAAGNNTGSKPTYPAYYGNCIAVAATDANDGVALWSGYGDWVDVAAPGVNIYSTLPINDYGYKSGTSMAAAYVSGVAGLLFTMVNDANGNGFVNDEVRKAIESNCDELGIKGIGKGRINVLEAVTYALPSK
jgi:thermitase